jgi:hypothetical protein
MPYTPPLGTSINIDLNDLYSPILGNQINTNLSDDVPIVDPEVPIVTLWDREEILSYYGYVPVFTSPSVVYEGDYVAPTLELLTTNYNSVFKMLSLFTGQHYLIIEDSYKWLYLPPSMKAIEFNIVNASYYGVVPECYDIVSKQDEFIIYKSIC